MTLKDKRLTRRDDRPRQRGHRKSTAYQEWRRALKALKKLAPKKEK